ncbi:hypothetical protein AGR6A_Cc40006 [Agrobacterium sp. NCPPB 925]|nr:hypothetical protein AGR6A_Cc40006 [Agrobacterium sp. NCPPB 925]
MLLSYKSIRIAVGLGIHFCIGAGVVICFAGYQHAVLVNNSQDAYHTVILGLVPVICNGLILLTWLVLETSPRMTEER